MGAPYEEDGNDKIHPISFTFRSLLPPLSPEPSDIVPKPLPPLHDCLRPHARLLGPPSSTSSPKASGPSSFFGCSTPRPSTPPPRPSQNASAMSSRMFPWRWPSRCSRCRGVSSSRWGCLCSGRARTAWISGRGVRSSRGRCDRWGGEDGDYVIFWCGEDVSTPNIKHTIPFHYLSDMSRLPTAPKTMCLLWIADVRTLTVLGFPTSFSQFPVNVSLWLTWVHCTLEQSAGPSFAGWVPGRERFWAAFVVARGLRRCFWGSFGCIVEVSTGEK